MAPAAERVNAFSLADTWLKALGWPSTPTSRRVLAAWFMRESPRAAGSNTDILVRGNNPLNITCTTCGNYWLAGGTHKIIIYNTRDAGITAFSQLIHGGGPGYSGIVSAFSGSSNNPTAIVKAINNSGWVTGKTNSYIYRSEGGTHNGLSETYNALGGNDIFPPLPADKPLEGGLPAGYTGPTLQDALGRDAKLDSPKTVFAIANELYAKYGAAGLGGNSAGDIGTYLVDFVGKDAKDVPFNFPGVPNYNKTQNRDGGKAVDPFPNPLNVFGGLAGKAVGIGAVLLGFGIAAFGAMLIAKDVYSSQGNGGGMIDVTPIILRD